MGFEEIPPKSPIAYPPASPSLARAVLTHAHQRSASRSSQTGSAPADRPRSGSGVSGVLSTGTGGSPPTFGLRSRSSSESEAARPASRPSSRASGSGRHGPPVVRNSEDEQS